MKGDGFYVKAGGSYWSIVKRGQRLGVSPKMKHTNAKQHHTRKEAEKTARAFGDLSLVADGTIKVVEIRDGKEVDNAL